MTKTPERPSSVDGDLTAKARIRNAALALYGVKGEPNTTVREIAQAAGVTHGLVVHHFGNKEGLRLVVQEHVAGLVRQAVEAVPPEGSALEIGRARDANVARLWSEHPDMLRYLRRVLLDPAEDGAQLLNLLADLTRTSVHELREAGVTRSKAPEDVQVMNVLMREILPRLAGPVIDQAWAHLTDGKSGAPPRLELHMAPR